MAGENEVARAYITIVPAFEKGMHKDITDTVVDGAGGAGDKAGTALAASMGASMGRGLKKAMVGLGGLLVGGAALKGLFEVGEQFDAMTDAIIVGTGASGEALEALRQSAIDVATSVPVSFEQAGGYIQDLNTRLDLTGENLTEVATAIAQLENVTGSAVNIETFSGAMQRWGVDADDMAGKLDFLFAVSQSTGIGIDQLTAIAEKNATQMQQLGYSFEDTVAMAGALDKAGLDASKDMNLLGRALVTLARDGEEPVDTLTRNVEEIGNLLEAGDEAAAMDLASQLFGTKGAEEFIAAIQSGAMNVDEFVASIGDSSGIISETYSATASFAESFQTLKNNLMALLEPVAVPFFDAVSAGMQAISDWVAEHGPEIQPILEDIGAAFGSMADGIGQKIGDNVVPALEKFRDFMTWCADHGGAVKAALIGVGVGLLLVKGASTFGPALQALSTGFGKLATNVPKVGKAAGASAGQILALGAAILMVGGGIALAALGFKMLADAAIALSQAGGAAIGIFAALALGIVGIGAAVLIALPGLTVGAPVLLAFGAALLMVGGAVAVAAVGIAYLVQTVAESAPQLVELMQGAAEAFGTAVQSIADGVSQVVDSIAGGATQIIDAISNLVDSVGGAVSGVLDSVAGVFDSIGTAALNAGTGVSQMVDALIRLTDTRLVDLGASCEEAARGIKNMAQAAGDGTGLNAVASSIQAMASGGMRAAAASQAIASGLMFLQANAGGASAAISAMASSIASSSTGLAQAAGSVRTFAASAAVIQLFGRQSAAAFKAFATAATSYSSQAVNAVRAACSAMAAAVSGTRLQMQPINVGKLPHFRFEGQFDAQTGRTPAIKVDWYATGAVFPPNSPQIIGVGDARRGNEILTPEQAMRDTFEDVLDDRDGDIVAEIRALREDVRRLRLCIDGDALVGSISERMDRALGQRQAANAKGF